MMVAGFGIDEDNLVALLAKSFAGLRAGIVELAGLTNDDRTRADDQDFVNGRCV